MKTAIRVLHSTRYRYSHPVKFGPHRLLLRPRDGHDMRLISSAIEISPQPRLRWHFDTFGNSVASAEFFEASDTLEIRSELLLRRFSHEDFLAAPGRSLIAYPFAYSEEDLIDLAPFIALENPHEGPAIAAWLNADPEPTADEALVFLRNLSDRINKQHDYVRRERSGTQSAATTIAEGSGSCRDFALLFMEAARLSGFAARFVTGYLNDTAEEGAEHTGGGSTHAWAEIYLPDEGWVEFDPTNRIIGSPNLIRVAVTRTPYQAIPISGIYEQHPGTTHLGMDVEVQVRNEPYDPKTDD
ncbi:transglutaminase family protein [Rhodobacterales bacterium]|nr:transglutaminase family protein [Rhodobacterales bacterium]